MTLVEVLVAMMLITVLSTGFMIASLEALRNSQDAAIRNTALLLVRDAAERLRTHRLNRSQIDSVAMAARQVAQPANCYRQTCTRSALALADWHALHAHVQRQLPEAGLHLLMPCGSGSDVACLWVTWRGAAPQDCLQPQQPTIHGKRPPGCLGVTLWLPGVNDVSA